MVDGLHCLLSGGKDSVCTAHCLAAEGRLKGCVFIDTGISTPDLEPFVLDLCRDQGWPLEVVRTPVSYEAHVLKYGFPGPPQHFMIMSALKGRAIRGFRKTHKDAVLASGVRRDESTRRFINVKEESTFEGLRVVAPIADWTTKQVWEYVTQHELPRSPAYKTLHISGDCLCGAYARPEEVWVIETFYPEIARRLRALEERVDGQPHIKDPVLKRWGKGGLGGFSAPQSRLEAFACGECDIRVVDP